MVPPVANKHVASVIVLSILLMASGARADDERRALLNRKEILVETRDIEGASLPEATVTAVLDAPPEKVWAIVEKCADYAKTMPRIKESRELSRDGDAIRCAVKFGSPWPLKDLEAVTLATHEVKPGRWSRSWTLEAGDYDRNEGSWTLTPFDEEGTRTLAVYRIVSEPHISVPDSVKKMAIRRGLPDLIKTLRKQVEK